MLFNLPRFAPQTIHEQELLSILPSGHGEASPIQGGCSMQIRVFTADGRRMDHASGDGDDGDTESAVSRCLAGIPQGLRGSRR